MAIQVTAVSNKQRAANTPERRAASSRGGRFAAETMRQQGNKSLAEMSDGETRRILLADIQRDPALYAKYKSYIADHEHRLAIAESV